MIAVDSSPRCVQRNNIENVQESIWLVVSLAHCDKLFFGSFYVAPNISPVLFDKVISSIEGVISFHSEPRVIFL